MDVGLAAHLQGWRAVSPLLSSPHAGPLFETLVFGELVRARDHRGLSLGLYFWRTKEGEEVDFIVDVSGPNGRRWIAIEAKLANQNLEPLAVPRALARELPEIHEIWIVTPGGEEARLSPTSIQLPIRRLADRLGGVVEF